MAFDPSNAASLPGSVDALKRSEGGARTAPSIVIKVTNPAGQVIPIGAVKSMERRISRTITRRRELDSSVPGISVELVPGPVTDFTLTIKRTMMNKKSMMEAFGYFSVEDLVYQNSPIEVEEHRYTADGNEQVVVYHGCYMKSNPVSVDIDQDWTMIQEVELDVTSCTVTG